MADILSDLERRAIEAFDGVVTTCPPMTFTEDVRLVSKVNIRSTKKSDTQRQRDSRIRQLAGRGADLATIAAEAGLTTQGAHQAIRRLGLQSTWKAARVAARRSAAHHKRQAAGLTRAPDQPTRPSDPTPQPPRRTKMLSDRTAARAAIDAGPSPKVQDPERAVSDAMRARVLRMTKWHSPAVIAHHTGLPESVVEGIMMGVSCDRGLPASRRHRGRADVDGGR